MSRSPEHLRTAEPSSRGAPYDSPTRYDSDFYIRKINRLENDMNLMQDELSSARIRLRRAEDFEIKFELANRQVQVITSQNDRLQKEKELISAELDRLRMQRQQAAAKPEQPDIEPLKAEIERWKRRSEEAERDSIQKLQRLNALSHRSQKDANKELEEFRREATDRQERYEAQIRQLNRQVAEKQTVDKFVEIKVDRIKQEKDKEIARLHGIIEAQKIQLEQIVSEKNQQTQKLKSRYDKIIDLELQGIHHNLENQSELFNVELRGLRDILEIKNAEIDELMRRSEADNRNHQSEKDDLKAQIKALTEALYKSEREAELELYNIKERLTAIHAEDLKNIQTKHDNQITILKENQAQTLKLMHLREEDCRKIEADRSRAEDAFRHSLMTKDNQIKELTARLSHTGDTNSKELHHLHQSLHTITSEKHEVAAGYLENIAFLDQQIKRLTATLEVRNVELKNLENLLSETKKRCDQYMRQADAKWKAERKEREQEREQLREEKQGVEQELREKQQAWRLKERAYQNVKERDGVEIDRLNCVVTELEKDVSRLNSYIKQLDDLLKKETRKTQTIMLDSGGAKRELSVELQRQQQQLEAIKTMEVDQLQKKFELDVDRLTNDNKRLKSQLLSRNLAFENLEEEFRKMEANNKILERINKDKMIEYQKKMAALNSEILLTQNLYQSFMEAKSRVKKESRA